ncbi:voltage-dependent calcium channel gamma-6 subunit isoform X2 [Esox lucius]|uniref:voltage-dependent calcium channel gamma-6 subunit isoform X2 n=1 Tax=Esox lucius TaxID=8010 RepID=UPI0009732EA3|nr:voltage-dependent calcium channel gamma-6 subunit isoform X2 [Esox lucius]
MWSTFFLHEDDGRPLPPGASLGSGALGGVMGGGFGGRGAGAGAMGIKRRALKSSTSGHPRGLTEMQEGKIKLAFFVAIVGVVMTVLGLGTDFWVELSPPKSFYNNRTCLAAHYGLWKGCTRTLWVADIDPERDSCGPAELPGESNCTYFKFYTTGENTVIFRKTTDKSLNVVTAMMALCSLFLMLMGSICISMSLSKGESFFLKPASVCFILSGRHIFNVLCSVRCCRELIAFWCSYHFLFSTNQSFCS